LSSVQIPETLGTLQIARVLVMGGTLLLREHDCGGRAELAPLFDLWHGLHAKVFAEELMPQRQLCRSNYMSRMQWLEALAKVGTFHLIGYQVV
jgi:hypothetical protein